jgi:hypothetical protein
MNNYLLVLKRCFGLLLAMGLIAGMLPQAHAQTGLPPKQTSPPNPDALFEEQVDAVLNSFQTSAQAKSHSYTDSIVTIVRDSPNKQRDTKIGNGHTDKVSSGVEVGNGQMIDLFLGRENACFGVQVGNGQMIDLFLGRDKACFGVQVGNGQFSHFGGFSPSSGFGGFR